MKNKVNKITLSLDLRLVVIALLAVVVVMLALWRPWQPAVSAEDQVITVTGEATVTARPDQFVFYPSYEFTGEDNKAALADAAKKSEQLVAALKKLGVDDKDIKTATNNYGQPYPVDGRERQEQTYTLQLTIRVADEDLARAVQDYLADTAPTGAVSPQMDFSEQKRKELEAQAREIAAKDARTKAEATADNIGFTLGSVKSLSEGNDFGISPMHSGRDIAVSEGSDGSVKPQLGLHPGENELRYSFSVTYYIR